jgi:hypothetical protein
MLFKRVWCAEFAKRPQQKGHFWAQTMFYATPPAITTEKATLISCMQ